MLTFNKSRRLSDLGLYSREEIFKILFCLWHRLCVVLQKLKKNALNQEYMSSQLVKNDWKHWSPENVSISIPAAGQQLIQIGCKGWRRDLHRSCWRAGEDWRPGNCFVPKQKSDGLSSLPHPSSSMHRLLLAEEMGRSREAKVRGVKIHPWRKPKPVVDPNQRLETAKQRDRDTAKQQDSKTAKKAKQLNRETE